MTSAKRSKIILRIVVILVLGLLFEISIGHNSLNKLNEVKNVFTNLIPMEEKVPDGISDVYYKGYVKDTSVLNTYGFAPYDVPEYDPATYANRIEAIEGRIPLTYNKYVQGYINLYLVRKRTLVTKVIGRSYDYFPLFDEVLAKHNMPAELRNLAIVESALSPEALSWCGAAGLWQFMPKTGQYYDLRVDNDVDERKDPKLSTEAAALYLKDLHRMYGDWLLAIAAYNCGPGNINKAIKKARKKKVYSRDFWSIKPFLPQETQDYVPAFIAACYMMNHYYDHNLKAIRPTYLQTELAEVEVKQGLTFKEMSKKLDITPEELAFFNPRFEKHGQVEVKDSTMHVAIPSNLEEAFYNHEQEIYANSELKKTVILAENRKPKAKKRRR